VFGGCGRGEMPFYEAIAGHERDVVEVEDLADISTVSRDDLGALLAK
jgi:hypothetical protein